MFALYSEKTPNILIERYRVEGKKCPPRFTSFKKCVHTIMGGAGETNLVAVLKHFTENGPFFVSSQSKVRSFSKNQKKGIIILLRSSTWLVKSLVREK